MNLPIPLDEIYFGERDGLHEIMKQDRANISVSDNSFVTPPKINLQELYSASRFFIVGPKGSGKTTLLWHLQRSDPNEVGKVILFKTHLRNEDRGRLDKMTEAVIVQDQNRYNVESDYKTVWEWFILRNFVKIISDDDVIFGKNEIENVRRILDVSISARNSRFDKIQIDAIRGNVKLGVDLSGIKSEVAAEINASRTTDDRVPLIDIVRICQDLLAQASFRAGLSYRIYFDELEFFLSADGDGTRDRRMIRDLIFTTYNINQFFLSCNLPVAVVTSIRSEVLGSISSNNHEIGKIVSAFGVNLNWYTDDIEIHRVLEIFANKIRQSEISAQGCSSDDVWTVYFPPQIGDRAVKKYLLDQGLHRPRGVLLRIQAALEQTNSSDHFNEADFLGSEDRFGELMLEEFSEEISTSYDERGRVAIMSLLRGYPYSFTRDQLHSRIVDKATKDKEVRRIRQEIGADGVINLLYRIGMIGNNFTIPTTNKNRQVWSFRGNSDPIMDQKFVVHQSVRKSLVTN